MAVTRDGIPVRCWTFPGSESDQRIIRTVKDDLGSWNLHRLVWVADRRLRLRRQPRLPHPRRRALHPRREAAPHQRRGRRRAGPPRPLPRRGRQPAGQGESGWHPAAATTRGRAPNGSWCATTRTPPPVTQRCASGSSSTCPGLIDGSDAWPKRKRDEFVGSLKGKPGLRRLLRRTKTGLLRIDRAAAQRESHYDGKWLLRTSDLTLTAEDLAAAYKQLIAVERGWRDCKTSLGLRPVYHHREDRIRAHVQLCWLALLLIRVAETRTGDTWRNLRHELDRMHLVTLATADGRVAQRSALTGDQKTILAALDLPEPPKYLDFTPFEAPAPD